VSDHADDIETELAAIEARLRIACPAVEPAPYSMRWSAGKDAQRQLLEADIPRLIALVRQLSGGKP
jgi:hypothetical protein